MSTAIFPLTFASEELYLLTAIGLGFLFGFDSGVINGTVDGLRTAFNSDSIGTGFNVASMLLGCAAGAFFAGRLADELGDKEAASIEYRRVAERFPNTPWAVAANEALAGTNGSM